METDDTGKYDKEGEKVNWDADAKKAVHRLINIIESCVFESDRHSQPPNSILWVEYQDVLAKLGKTGLPIHTKFGVYGTETKGEK